MTTRARGNNKEELEMEHKRESVYEGSAYKKDYENIDRVAKKVCLEERGEWVSAHFNHRNGNKIRVHGYCRKKGINLSDRMTDSEWEELTHYEKKKRKRR